MSLLKINGINNAASTNFSEGVNNASKHSEKTSKSAFDDVLKNNIDDSSTLISNSDDIYYDTNDITTNNNGSTQQTLINFEATYNQALSTIKQKAINNPKDFWETISNDTSTLKAIFGEDYDRIKDNWTTFKDWFQKTFSIDDFSEFSFTKTLSNNDNDSTNPFKDDKF